MKALLPHVIKFCPRECDGLALYQTKEILRGRAVYFRIDNKSGGHQNVSCSQTHCFSDDTRID